MLRPGVEQTVGEHIFDAPFQQANGPSLLRVPVARVMQYIVQAFLL